jgi:hypothetical protein
MRPLAISQGLPSGTPVRRKSDAVSRTTPTPDPRPLDSLNEWAGHQDLNQEARAARSEVVRLLEFAANHPNGELNLTHCDAQACLDLPAHLVEAYKACTNSDPRVTRLILPNGLTDVPAWITMFKELKELTAHGFMGDANAALVCLKRQRPGLTCDLPRTTLRSVYRPYVGTLHADAKDGLQRFMNNVRGVLSARGSDYHVGGFKVDYSSVGGLQLVKLVDPPIDEADDLDPDSPDAEDLPKTIEVFDTHFEDVQAAVWQAMSECGYVEYLTANAEKLRAWDILVDINPYFNRNPLNIRAHKDTQGENMFLLLLHCNDQPIMGMEYQLRPKNPPDYSRLMEQQLPSVFVKEVKDILKDPPEGIAYAPTIEPWGFIGACDELIAHSTPFIHHRGAFLLESVAKCMGDALGICFGAGAASEYSEFQRGFDKDSPRSVHVRGALEVVMQLKQLAFLDDCIDPFKLEELLLNAKLELVDAKKLVKSLEDMVITKDPFDGTAVIDIPSRKYEGQMTVPRGRDRLQREMSRKLEDGTAHSNPGSRHYLRVWIMARLKD